MRVALFAVLAASGLAGCGPEKPFCKDAGDYGYVCQTISDAGRPEAGEDKPAPKDGPIVVGDDEDAGTP